MFFFIAFSKFLKNIILLSLFSTFSLDKFTIFNYIYYISLL
nr:MAG TPA: hypothetical protein [Inoviridae sp.]